MEKDTIAEVIVTDLVVRTAAGVGADSEIMEVRLTTGDLVYVIDGPIRVDGYPWLLVAELGPRFGPEPLAAGWVAAASRDGEEWVTPSDPPCPSDTSVQAFASVPEALLLYCFAGQELVLDGALGFCAHGDPVVQEPAWLANYACAFEASEPPEAEEDWPMIYVHLPPGLELPPYVGDRLPMRISGRFDAPAAKTCQYAEGAEQSFLRQITKLEEALLAFACRRSFVVEAVRPL